MKNSIALNSRRQKWSILLPVRWLEAKQKGQPNFSQAVTLLLAHAAIRKASTLPLPKTQIHSIYETLISHFHCKLILSYK